MISRLLGDLFVFLSGGGGVLSFSLFFGRGRAGDFLYDSRIYTGSTSPCTTFPPAFGYLLYGMKLN